MKVREIIGILADEYQMDEEIKVSIMNCPDGRMYDAEINMLDDGCFLINRHEFKAYKDKDKSLIDLLAKIRPTDDGSFNEVYQEYKNQQDKEKKNGRSKQI